MRHSTLSKYLHAEQSPYDAPYAAITARSGIPLVTTDARLAGAAGSLGVEVRVPTA